MNGHRSSFVDRYNDGKHPAEDVFEAMYGKPYTRYGLDNPDMKVGKLPYFVRHTPDFLTEEGLVECKGVGSDQRLKVKDVEWEAWALWSQLCPLEVSIYDSSKERWALVPHEQLKILKADIAGGTKYDWWKNDGVAHWSFLVNRLEVRWHSVE